MKVLLISPSVETSLSSTMPDRFKKVDLGHYPPLGIMYLASYLEKFSSHRAELLDTAIEEMNINSILERIRQSNPKVVGLYTTSLNINIVFEIVNAIKELDKDLITILGGPHTDIYSEETASLPGVDFVVAGEGEITLTELLDCFEKGSDLKKIKGIIYNENGNIRINEKRPMIEKLDDLPLPARHLLPFNKYYSVIGKNKISTTIMTSRGCPYRCNFCFIQYGGRYRMRSAENVLIEIEECVKIGIREFFFFDEIFTTSKSRVMNICNEIIKRRLNIAFDIRSRVNTIDEEMLFKLKEAGCGRIQYGVENGNDEILQAMNKGTTVEQARKVVKLTKKAGISILIDIMIGYPGETKQQIENTMKFSKEIDPDFIQIGITTLFPGTKIYKDALENGFLKEDYWKKIAKNPPQKIAPPFASEKFSREELEKLLHEVYIKFYFRLGYMFKRLFKITSLTGLFRQIRTGLQLLSGK
ncbi:MAG: radical SAM protein [Elusimicrobiota bacterium]